MAIAVYMPIGPADDEIGRAADVLDSVVAYSHSLAWVVLVDDAAIPRPLAARIALPSSCALTVLHNPRNGVGNGRTGGMCVSNLIAYDYIHRTTAAAWVLKLDTDSLVIAPFEDRLEQLLSARPDAGLLGVIGDGAAADRTYHFMDHNRQIFEIAMRIGDEFSALRTNEVAGLHRWGVTSETQFQQFRCVRRVLETAVSRGYRSAEYCQGGGYAVTRRLLDVMAAAGRFDDPFLWCELEVAEDVMMGLLCAAAGLTMHDASGRDQPFTVEGPLPFSSQELVDMNTCVIHSIKGEREEESRRFFRTRRVRGHC